MPLFVKVRSLLRNLFSFRRVEADLDEEVRSHLEMLMEENLRAGMPKEEALRAVRIELGGIEQVKEQVREERIGNWLRNLQLPLRRFWTVRPVSHLLYESRKYLMQGRFSSWLAKNNFSVFVVAVRNKNILPDLPTVGGILTLSTPIRSGNSYGAR
jgi:hypothetical protein